VSAVAADNRYEASFVPNRDGGRPVGHVVVRRLDDRVTVVRVPVEDEKMARAVLSKAEVELRGTATDFEAEWGIGPSVAADPGPDVANRESADDPDGGERITSPDDRITVLPEPADVFVADQDWLAPLLHPLVSIDLSAVDPDWSGRVHLLSPVEPEDGLLGETTTAHHDDHTGENWLSFRVEDDGRYRFLGDRRFFSVDDHADLYTQAAAEFAGTKVRYARAGALVWGDEIDPAQQRDGWGTDIALVDQFGGDPGYGNWVATPPAAFTLDQTGPATPVLRLADGRPFTFIAATAGYPWRHSGADGILLFFEPETRTAVLTFDWS
jgi:hypothetical protein